MVMREKNIPKKVNPAHKANPGWISNLRNRNPGIHIYLRLQEEWIPIINAKDIGAGELVPFEQDGQQLLIAADVDGKLRILKPRSF